jgi:hypothetical protein
MDLEEQLRVYTELRQKIEELEEQKKALGAAIMQQMQEKTLSVSDYVIRRYSRLSYKLSIAAARAFDATKMEETVDKDKLKALYYAGNLIPGISEIHYIQVTSPKKLG